MTTALRTCTLGLCFSNFKSTRVYTVLFDLVEIFQSSFLHLKEKFKIVDEQFVFLSLKEKVDKNSMEK